MDEAGQVRNEELDPQREALRQTALAQIRQYPDPVLQDANGVGLAANQVGIIRRVFVFQPDPDSEPVAVVNPVIVERGGETVSDEEGCLSMQGVQVRVERPPTVRLEGRDPEGGEISMDLGELGARVAQHELDHLDGVLILDRTTDEARSEALGILRPRAVLAP
jgi:peptide deformylase